MIFQRSFSCYYDLYSWEHKTLRRLFKFLHLGIQPIESVNQDHKVFISCVAGGAQNKHGPIFLQLCQSVLPDPREKSLTVLCGQFCPRQYFVHLLHTQLAFKLPCGFVIQDVGDVLDSKFVLEVYLHCS